MPISALADYELLVFVNNSTEANYSFWLKDKPKITFKSGNTLEVSDSKTSTPHTFTFSSTFHFEVKENNTGIPTDIEDIKEEIAPATLHLSFTDDNTIIANGVEGNARAQVFAINGRVAATDIERSGDRLTIHLNSLPQGVYVIRIGNQSFKIYKKS